MRLRIFLGGLLGAMFMVLMVWFFDSGLTLPDWLMSVGYFLGWIFVAAFGAVLGGVAGCAWQDAADRRKQRRNSLGAHLDRTRGLRNKVTPRRFNNGK